MHSSQITKMSIQTEKKTEVDFMTIKIRSPTQKNNAIKNLTLGDD